MKAFTRYISKHLLSFLLVIIILALLNVLFFTLCFYRTVHSDFGAASPNRMLELFDGCDIESGAPDEALAALRENNIWAMLLSPEGDSLWRFDTPAGLPERYTVQDAAVFSKGYLNEYPVFVRAYDEGLLVLGYPKDSYAKITGNYFPVNTVQKLPAYMTAVLIFDILFLFFAFHVSRLRVVRGTGPIINAVERLAEGKPAELSVSGDLTELADAVRSASLLIASRDRARANWISGVSHDIRTPLSVITGYAEQIAANKNADELIRSQAETVRRQSVEIKELVQDLNLVSKLEYDMQPLNRSSVRLSKLLREYAVELINGGISEQYSIALAVSPDAEGIMLDCDPRLITRAVNGLVQNSLRHNPDGCSVALSLGLGSSGILISVSDDGVGISPEKLREMEQTPHYMDCTDESLNLRHGLGLLIVRQIVTAHGGEFTLQNLPEKGLKATMRFPL